MANTLFDTQKQAGERRFLGKELKARAHATMKSPPDWLGARGRGTRVDGVHFNRLPAQLPHEVAFITPAAPRAHGHALHATHGVHAPRMLPVLTSMLEETVLTRREQEAKNAVAVAAAAEAAAPAAAAPARRTFPSDRALDGFSYTSRDAYNGCRTLFEAPARTGLEPRTGYRGILTRLNVLDRAEQSAILKSVLVTATASANAAAAAEAKTAASRRRALPGSATTRKARRTLQFPRHLASDSEPEAEEDEAAEAWQMDEHMRAALLAAEDEEIAAAAAAAAALTELEPAPAAAAAAATTVAATSAAAATAAFQEEQVEEEDDFVLVGHDLTEQQGKALPQAQDQAAEQQQQQEAAAKADQKQQGPVDLSLLLAQQEAAARAALRAAAAPVPAPSGPMVVDLQALVVGRTKVPARARRAAAARAAAAAAALAAAEREEAKRAEAEAEAREEAYVLV